MEPDGKCTSCAQPALNSETITCCSCFGKFHAICSSTGKQQGICNQSFLKLFLTSTTKSNFKWFCDTCLTEFEAKKVTTLEEKFTVLADQLTSLSREFQDVKQAISTNDKSTDDNSSKCCGKTTCGHGVSQPTPWGDENRVQKMKSSLVIKHKTGDSEKVPTDLNKLRDIAVANNIPVSNVGVSKNGNTFIHCPSVEDRNKLQPLLSEQLITKDVVSLKEKQPHITILDITSTDDKDILLEQIRSQNPKIDALIESGEQFDILFTKTQQSSQKVSAVAKVSCSIRDAIKANRNRVFIGINSCRVFDRFYVKRCNHCQQYGHFKDNCQYVVKCGYCGEGHSSETCGHKATEDFSKLSCINCKRNGLAHNGHSAFWAKCPSYVIAQKKDEGK